MIGVLLSADVASDLIRSPAHGLVADDPVTFSPYQTPLPGLDVGVVYYVIATGLTTDAFKVSTTMGGSAVDLGPEAAFLVRSAPLTDPPHPPGSICVVEDVGTLTIDGVSLRTPAWAVTDLSDLWASLPSLRGTNVVLPDNAGQKPYPRRIDQNVALLPFEIVGSCDQDGVPYLSEEVGLELNSAYLLANVMDPPTPPTSTRSATLQTPSGATYSANVQVTGFHHREDKEPGLLRYVIELTIPDGRFS